MKKSCVTILFLSFFCSFINADINLGGCFNSMDATSCFQNAIDAGHAVIIVPNMGSPWYVGPIYLRSNNQEIIFEDGVEIVAKPGAFPSATDHLFRSEVKSNITLKGQGIVKFRMQKSEYTTGEWRHAIGLYSCTNITIENIQISDSGGDGIYIGNKNSTGIKSYCENIIVRNVIIDNCKRNAMSVISVKDLLVENSVFKNTNGTSPEEGLDFEPNNPYERLQNCKIINCLFENNKQNGTSIRTYALTSSSEPISITFEDCTSRGALQRAFILIGGGDNGVCGNVSLKRCTFEGSQYNNFLIQDVSPGTIRTQVDWCIFRDKLTITPQSGHCGYGCYNMPQIYFRVFNDTLTKEIGGVDFAYCLVEEGKNLTFAGCGAFGTAQFNGLRGVTGEFVVLSPYPATYNLWGVGVIVKVLSDFGYPSPLLLYNFDDPAGTVVNNAGSLGSKANLNLFPGSGGIGDAPIFVPGARPMANLPYSQAIDNSYGNQVMGGNGGRARAAVDIDELEELESFTIAGWIYTPGINFAGTPRIITKGDSSPANGGFSVETSGDSSLVLFVNGYRYTSAPVYKDLNYWRFFAITWDGSDIKQPARFYYGNTGTAQVQLVSDLTYQTIDLGKTQNNTSLLTLLNTSDGTRCFKAMVDHIAFWGEKSGAKGALSQSELQSYKLDSQRYILNSKITCSNAVERGYWLLPGDVNRDCKVDLTDLAEMADNWLKNNSPENISIRDLW